jgi:toxin ParE1/3/4
VDSIKTSFDQLLTFPLSGPARDHLAPGLRVKVHGAYAIYYTPSARELIIVRVLHGARDTVAIAAGGGFVE